jgi:ribonuclease Z
MPKEQKSTLRHLRPNYAAVQGAPSEAFLQVIGDGSAGSPSAVMLVTSSSRYLFNCGEGTQRFIHEHKLRLARVENVFFTTKSWKNIGGLPGLSLTVKDIGVPKLTLHGPKGINDIYAMTKRFLQVRTMINRLYSF